MNYSLSASSVHGILQARVLEWVAIPYPGDPDPGINSASPPLAGEFQTLSFSLPLEKWLPGAHTLECNVCDIGMEARVCAFHSNFRGENISP